VQNWARQNPPFLRVLGKRLEVCDGGLDPLKRALGTLRVSVGLLAGGVALGNAALQHAIREIGDAAFRPGARRSLSELSG